MRSAYRFALPSLLAALWVVAVVIWVRSYWRVDKLWVQVLPKVTVEARLTPGQVTFGSTRSTVRLPVGDSHWFTWPVDAYFAEFIPPPANTLLSEFRIYNGTVTIPLWFLAFLAALPNLAAFLWPLVNTVVAFRSRRAPAQPSVIATVIPAGSLLRPNHPLIAVGQAVPDAQSASVMQVVS